MTHRITLEPLFVLHTRPYSNTSLIADCFSMRHGRFAALARSARGLKSRYRGKLQPFVPMLASWSGNREMKNLGDIELHGAPYALDRHALVCGFYLNELLMRLLQRDDPCPTLFNIYQMTLNALEKGQNIQIVLRCFEKNLLRELGYGLNLDAEALEGRSITMGEYYQYIPDRGFVLSDACNESVYLFKGECLLALHTETFLDEAILRDIKRLMRLVLRHYLGSKPLKSRELMT